MIVYDWGVPAVMLEVVGLIVMLFTTVSARTVCGAIVLLLGLWLGSPG